MVNMIHWRAAMTSPLLRHRDVRLCVVVLATVTANALLQHTERRDHIACVLVANTFLACCMAASGDSFTTE